ncbi:MAG: ABC transporter permease [Bacteroidales bacterium]|nr:ABC transporter permease [Bacteroidales bacterium]
MFDLDCWQEIYDTLRKNKMRTFMTAFGVFWGILMLVVMLGAGKGFENGIFTGMGDFATNSAFLWRKSTTIPYKGFPKGRWFTFTNDDIKALRDNVPEIDRLAPREEMGESTVVYGLNSGKYRIQGDYPDYNHIDPVEIIHGRFINEMDIKTSRKTAVVGQRVVEDLFGKGEMPVGKHIRIQGAYFRIVGVFASKHSGGWGERQEQSITLPFTAMQRTYNMGNRIYEFSMTARPDVPVSRALEKATAVLLARHSISPDDTGAIGSHDMEAEFGRIQGLFTGINILVWLVGIGTLLAGVIGVSNIMLVVIRERTCEIGIRRAIGATPYAIVLQIVLEAVVLTAIAGYFGLSCGVGLLELFDHAFPPAEGRMFARPEVNFWIAVKALCILIVSGALAGMIPACKAIRVKPVDALRDE